MNNNTTTQPNRSSIPADYAKVEIVTSDAVLLKVETGKNERR